LLDFDEGFGAGVEETEGKDKVCVVFIVDVCRDRLLFYYFFMLAHAHIFIVAICKTLDKLN